MDRTAKSVVIELTPTDNRVPGGILTSVKQVGFDGRYWWWVGKSGARNDYDSRSPNHTERFRYTLSQELMSQQKAMRLIQRLKDEWAAANPGPAPVLASDGENCPVCGERYCSGCRCSGPHSMEALMKGHGRGCANGHRWSGDVVYNPKTAGIKTAFDPNDATLADLEGGWQFSPKFASGKSFILTDGGIYVRGPYGSETFRRIASLHHFLELGLQHAPEAVKIAFNYWKGSYSNLANNLMDIPEFFHIKKVTIGGYLASIKTAFQQGDVVVVDMNVIRQEIPAHGGPRWYKELRRAMSHGWGALKIWEMHGDEAKVIANHPLGILDGIIPVPVRALRMAKEKGVSMNRTAVARELVGVAKLLAGSEKVAARKLKYRGYTIEESGMNYYVTDPSGHRAFGEVPANIETAKKWIDWDIHEKGGG